MRPLAPLPLSLWLATVVAFLPFAAAAAPCGATRLDDDVQSHRLSKAELAEAAKKKQQEFPAAAKIKEIVKGDVWLTDAGQPVRLIGVDVPTADEAKRFGNFYGKAAMDYVAKLVLDETVQLAYDVQRYDGFGRLLVHVTAGHVDVNADLVRRGYGMAACTAPNNSRCQNYRDYQREAMRLGRGLWGSDKGNWPEPLTTYRREQVVVKSVVDGDTVKLADGRVVRYTAIDAMEDEQMYEDGTPANAAFELNSKLTLGQSVTLEYDAEVTDPRGRTLAYVHVDTPDGTVMVNEELVRHGVAWVAVFPPNINQVGRLLKAQYEARAKKIGIWSSDQSQASE